MEVLSQQFVYPLPSFGQIRFELLCLKHVIFLAGDMENSMGSIMYISFGDYLVRRTAWFLRSPLVRKVPSRYFLKAVGYPADETKGSRKNNFTEWTLGFGSDLADPIEQNRRHSTLCRGFASEVSGKDGRKPRWQNVKLFLREPYC